MKVLCASVENIQTDKKSLSRPHALNTVELLKVSSSGLGLSPHQTVIAFDWVPNSPRCTWQRGCIFKDISPIPGQKRQNILPTTI